MSLPADYHDDNYKHHNYHHQYHYEWLLLIRDQCMSTYVMRLSLSQYNGWQNYGNRIVTLNWFSLLDIWRNHLELIFLGYISLDYYQFVMQLVSNLQIKPVHDVTEIPAFVPAHSLTVPHWLSHRQWVIIAEVSGRRLSNVSLYIATLIVYPILLKLWYFMFFNWHSCVYV